VGEQRDTGESRLTNSIPSESWEYIESIRSTGTIIFRSSRSFVPPPPLQTLAFRLALRDDPVCAGTKMM
jgi:hypothetical protein